MVTIQQRKVDPHDADRLWNEHRPLLGDFLALAIRDMGLPMTDGEGITGNGAGRGRTPGYHAVKVALYRDRDLHDAIFEFVEDAYSHAVAAGSIWDGHVRGWLAKVTRRITMRLATKRAEVLLRTLAPYDDSEDEPWDDVPDGERPPDEEAARREIAQRLALAVRWLSAEDRRVLDAKVENTYAALARELGVSEGSLRTRACRIWKEVRAAAVRPDDEDEGRDGEP